MTAEETGREHLLPDGSLAPCVGSDCAYCGSGYKPGPPAVTAEETGRVVHHQAVWADVVVPVLLGFIFGLFVGVVSVLVLP